MNEYDSLKAERNRLKALMDGQPVSRRHIPEYKAVEAKYIDAQQKIKDLFRNKPQ